MSDLAERLRRRVARRPQAVFLTALAVVYAVVLIFTNGLHQEIYKDEAHFWETAKLFTSYQTPPTLDELRTYPEVLTPLSFVIWAGLERALEGGILAGRALNFALSFLVLCVIALRREPEERAILCGIGLILCPYYLPLSVHLYTDMPALFLGLLGVWLYAHGRPVESAVLLALAIATRQYMLSAPAALAAWAFFEFVRGRTRRFSLWLAPAAAAASILVWFWIFGGLGPPSGIDKWVPLFPAPMMEFFQFIPAYGMYFLTVIGAFFVVPEWLLFRRWRDAAPAAPFWTGRTLVIAAVLGVAYAAFPPLIYEVPMGALDRLVRPFVPGDFARMCVFYLLALGTCLRFKHLDISFWILVVNFFMNMKAQLSWEKYAVPVLALLWYLKSIGALDGGAFPLSRTAGSDSASEKSIRASRSDPSA